MDSGLLAPTFKRWWHILLFLAARLSYATVYNSLASIIMPKLIKDIQPRHASRTLGLIAGCGAILELGGLATMFFSDLCTSRFGRRRPFITAAAFLIGAGCITLSCGAFYYLLPPVIAGYYLCLLGVSMGGDVLAALVPDLTPTPQHGLGSGLMALHNFLGSAIGYMLAAVSVPIVIICWLYILVLALCHMSTLLTANEIPLRENHDTVNYEFHWKTDRYYRCSRYCGGVRNFFQSYTFPAVKYRDFIFAMLMRFCYYMNAAGIFYLQYWLADVADSDNPSADMGKIALINLGTAIVVAIPAGKLSDVVGRKVIAVLALMLVMFCFVSFVFIRKMAFVYLMACIYGLGNGLFTGVEFAIACDTLPAKASSGKFMAEFTMAMMVGMMIGELIGGLVLTPFHVPHQAGSYTETGYMVLFLVCAGFLWIAGLFAVLINKKRAQAAQVDRLD
ncbi:major facilitator superfamily protein [Pelomyxa schiedti]|nr:major facilitator superfamily protein [Pelomyxa schiedti]